MKPKISYENQYLGQVNLTTSPSQVYVFMYGKCMSKNQIYPVKSRLFWCHSRPDKITLLYHFVITVTKEWNNSYCVQNVIFITKQENYHNLTKLLFLWRLKYIECKNNTSVKEIYVCNQHELNKIMLWKGPFTFNNCYDKQNILTF